ncbi:helix-turn-helix domain-containing protein [Streptomyces cacaoi]|uniref:helix-turn-helix domain-containing protein n=2 Tax=Streptomyces TaxID=1883 RepID=UPI002620B0FD|nr:helix-turn-helix transcriptional regulator [Streptomyces cacaoi]
MAGHQLTRAVTVGPAQGSLPCAASPVCVRPAARAVPTDGAATAPAAPPGPLVGYREPVEEGVLVRRFPSSRVLLVVAFGDPVRVGADGDAPARPLHSLVAGLQEETRVLGVGGSQHGVRLWLSPLTAYSLLGAPMHLVSNAYTELADLWGPRSARLTEQLAAAEDWAARFALLTSALARLRAEGPQPDPAVAYAWRQLTATAGTARVGALAERVGVSRRHLVRRFRQQVGLPPKTVARLLRFERAGALLRSGGRTLAEVAAQAGYADQSHLTRDVREFTGVPAGELTALLRPAAPPPPTGPPAVAGRVVSAQPRLPSGHRREVPFVQAARPGPLLLFRA